MNKNLTKITITSGLILILYHFLQWYLVELLTPFAMPFLSLTIHGWFFVMFILTIIHVIKYKNWKPFVIQIIIIVFWLCTPFTLIYLKLDFIIHKENRTEVVELINHKELTPNVNHDNRQIHLPKQFATTSKGGGDVRIQHGENGISVFFFTYRGILDNFSGFIYAPNDVKPNKSDFNSEFKEITKIEKNWYYVSSY
ncbi:hypothetical protein BHU24_28765 [Bacillus pseudomycoides]|uniref:hypothetical protein n=1 Tax=Bacillus pseudomycoides TaxID=64104 RepID=UPI000BEB2F3A|nr:hypothetical protein [Bacillus pseudomycoides]MBD5798595.1 hypothetical protein [Bacillus pseudomycoides]MED1477317.1 hypothetical protein [Bacillus pseudomycoides]PDZ09783.1 hypothetical protein CON70_19805 [Bacillus pseudomycoides]PDZ72900.1 hypothetical protein CON58_15580 [Bacillus pseudomycoides]PEK33349.1 hypothetical protein CN691_15375 [Bacillus pseudomycoides]